MDSFKIGDKVVKNEENWYRTEFDNWGRGIGVGVVIEPEFKPAENWVKVRWPKGECFEHIGQLNHYTDEE